ncbi:hypothetical protein MD588_24200 [Photobacterium sp. SDRW27]|uniref:hypothetical protein n=1 Tax=Photobacterium obscurum TaxID=2829490 RepID=UPI0022443596|nr:hypothetical protein [Photobacterium obscurum]MCW8331906.1 hypothetical protein [Photobacterium obscurum]
MMDNVIVKFSAPTPCLPLFLDHEPGEAETLKILFECPTLNPSQSHNRAFVSQFIRASLAYYCCLDSDGISEDETIAAIFSSAYRKYVGGERIGRLFCNEEGEGGIDDISISIYTFYQDLLDMAGLSVESEYSPGRRVVNGVPESSEINTVGDLIDTYARVIGGT